MWHFNTIFNENMCNKRWNGSKVYVTDYAGPRDYVDNLYSPWRTLHRSPSPTEKDDPDPVVADSDPLVASSVRVFCARNLQLEGRSLPRQGRDHLFQLDVGISVGFFTETTGSLRNPETRPNPSYVYDNLKLSFYNLTELPIERNIT